MSEIIERVAKAIQEAEQPHDPNAAMRCSIIVSDRTALVWARAAIEAMRNAPRELVERTARAGPWHIDDTDDFATLLNCFINEAIKP